MSEKSEKCDQLQKIKNLKVKNLKACNIVTKQISGVTGTFQNLNTTNLNTVNLNTTNLNVTNINGVPYCPNRNVIIPGIITPVIYNNGTPVKPTNSGFNQLVFDQLWFLTQLTGAFLNLDADSGRYRNNILSNFYGCNTCPSYDTSSCPNPSIGNAVITGSITGNILTVTSVTSGSIAIGQRIFWNGSSLNYQIVSQLSPTSYTVSNSINDYSTPVPEQQMLTIADFTAQECINVPMTIYGVESVSLVPSNTTCQNLLSQISYNLNIVNRTSQTRVAAVYVLLGYIDPNNSSNVVLKSIEIDTRQFDPSILSFGEQMNNTVLLPSDLISLASQKSGLLQLVVYVEDGMNVIIPTQTTNTQNNSAKSNILLKALIDTPIISSLNSNYQSLYANTASPDTIVIDSNDTLISNFNPYYNVSLLKSYSNLILYGAGGGGNNSFYYPVFCSGSLGGGGGQGYKTTFTVPNNATYFSVKTWKWRKRRWRIFSYIIF
jgi:hypothetical protein